MSNCRILVFVSNLLCNTEYYNVVSVLVNCTNRDVLICRYRMYRYFLFNCFCL